MNYLRRTLLLGTAMTSLAQLARAADAASAAAGHPVARQMPVLFIGHGSPMNAISDNAFTQRLRVWGEQLPRPTAILVVSAHWLTPGQTLVDSQRMPPTLHDFGGFPAELHAVQYPAKGHPELARELARVLPHVPVKPDARWGLDHGTWSVLRHLYPQADVPVLQLSIDYPQPGAYHLELGRQLRFLRSKGVLIVGSGNLVHNLRATVRAAPEAPRAVAGWAQSFDDAVTAALEQRDDAAVVQFERLSGAAMSVPTPDHYWPFLYALGAALPAEVPKTIYASFQSGTISMRCLQWG